MPQMREITEDQLKRLGPEEMVALAQQDELEQRDQQIAQRDEQLQRKEHELRHKDAKLEELTFELARFKRWNRLRSDNDAIQLRVCAAEPGST